MRTPRECSPTLCARAGVTPQYFVSRSDIGCGSTIGPISAARVGMPTVDVGNPMLSMHSCREMAGAADVAPMIDVLGAVPVRGRWVSPNGSDDRAFIERSVRLAIIGAAVIGVGLAALWLLKGALTPLAAALVIAYLFDPLIDRFEARGISRRAAIVILLRVRGRGAVRRGVRADPGDAARRGVAVRAAAGLSRARPRGARPASRARVRRARCRARSTMRSRACARASCRFRSTRCAACSSACCAESRARSARCLSLLIIPVLAYYLLVEFDRIRHAVLDLVPRAYQARVATEAARVDALISGFIRGSAHGVSRARASSTRSDSQ